MCHACCPATVLCVASHARRSRCKWWIDALTIDPKVLLEDQDVIAQRGLERMVIECDLANASLGSVPSVMVYIAVHPVYGTKVFFPKHGMKRGKKHARDGADVWIDDITEEQANFIKSKAYYNKPETLRELAAKRSPQRQQKFWKGLFAAKNFLVRAHALSSICTLQKRGNV